MAIYQTLISEIKNPDSRVNYAQPVPVGMPVTLKYSDKGILTKVEIYPDSSELPFELTVELEKANVLIQRLQVYKTECDVFGVLVASALEYTFTKTSGAVPECFYNNMLKLINKKPGMFKFYAIDIKPAHSSSLPAAAALNRLAVMKFNVLQGIATNSSSKIPQMRQTFEKQIQLLHPDLPKLAGIYVHGARNYLISNNLKCGPVSKFNHVIDVNGYIHGELKCDLGEGVTSVAVPYTQIVQHHLSSNSFVILDSENNIQYVSQPKTFSRLAPETITCPVCGKKYAVNPAAPTVSCIDTHCPSKLYLQICRMLAKFKLPRLSVENFMKYSQSSIITTLQDVFKLEEYADSEIVTTLSNLIEAITPVSLLSGDTNSISKFVNQASSSTAVSYYIHNPGELSADLNVSKTFATRFNEYWSDEFNVNTFDTFISSDNITIEAPDKKFEGDLIFRNKLICLTGEFRHGSYDEMMSILKSYAGTPTVEYTAQVNFVIVGHFGKPDPYIIEKARAHNTPIYRELEFFKAYKIDEDLQKRHLI